MRMGLDVLVGIETRTKTTTTADCCAFNIVPRLFQNTHRKKE